jgi:hypothetical protein
LAIVEPADISELTSESTGKGVGAGATTGVTTGAITGGGGGGGLPWASADVDAAARASPRTIATAVTDLRPASRQSLARENHDEQRINAFPKNQAPTRQKMQKIPVGRADLLPILPERQSVVIPANGRLPGIVVRLPQVTAGGPIAELIS